MDKIKCKWCGRELTPRQKECCSYSCSGHIKAEKNRKNMAGAFFDKKLQSKAGKIGSKVSRERKVSAFFNEKIQSKNGKKAQAHHKEKGIGFFNSKTQTELGKRGAASSKKLGVSAYFNNNLHKKNGKKAIITCRKRGTGWFDSKIQKENGRKGGQKAMEVIRKHSKYIWKRINFLSNEEMICASKILSTPLVGINCHISVGTKTIDFYPQSYDKMFQGCFIEYHPSNKFLKPNETPESYYTERRKALDDNGFKDKKLIVIQGLKELA